MSTPKQRSIQIFSTFLLGQLLLFLPTIAEEGYAPASFSQDVQAWDNVPKRCGSDCTCGCVTGGACTCVTPQYNVVTPQYNAVNPQYNAETSQYNIQAFQYNTEPQYNMVYQPDPVLDNDSCNCRPSHVDPGLTTCEPCCDGGIWLPEDPVLFRPFMADPREICYSAGWRFNDNAMTKNVIDVSFGDTLAIYRWCDVWPWGGELQIELEGALWATFDPTTESSPLLNADYYGGIPITYAIDNWQFRLRGFHISSHIGDEFLLNHPGFDRRNASAEYIDFFISHDLTEEIRIYGGLGYLVAQDKEFKIKPFYSAVGAELRLLSWGFVDKCDRLYGCPIYGMHFRQNGEFKRHIDATYILGYEFGKLCGLYRKLRFFIEYHDGYSLEGQFCKVPTNYFSVRTSYGF